MRVCAGVPGVNMWQQEGAALGNAVAQGARGARGERRERRPRQIRVRMVQINLRAILQLAVMGIILYQVCLHSRIQQSSWQPQ